MPSILTRLKALVPGFAGSVPTPVVSPQDRRIQVVKDAKTALENSHRRERPRSEEKVPQNYYSGVAGKIWFLPHQDSATKDSAEIRAAMRMMPRDPYVKAAWWSQVLNVASQDGQVQPSEPGNPESEEQANAVSAMLDEYLSGGKPVLAQSICTPLGPDGFTLAEKVWSYASRGRLAGKVVLSALKPKDPDYLHVRGDEFGNVTHITTTKRAGEVYPISDFVFVRYLPIFNEPLGMAAFRASYGSYWMHDTVRKLRAIHHEKRMAGMLVGTYQNDDEKTPLETALENAKTATWMSIPEGCRVEALALSTAAEPDYKSFCESLREEIVTGISGAALQILQGTTPDARGDSKVQKGTSDLFPWLLAVLIQEAVTSQIIRDFIDFNYPYAAGGGYPRYTLGAVAQEELLQLVQFLEAAQRIGMKPSKKYYARSLSIQQADENDPEDVMESPASALPMPGAAPVGGGDPFMFGEDWQSFGWQAARSRTGTTKAVGTGENAGSVLYGADADAALSGGNEDTRDDDELKRIEQQASSGDMDAGVAVQRKAQVHADKLLNDPSQRKAIDREAGSAAWKEASVGLTPQQATTIGTHLATLTAGEDASPGVLRQAFGGLVSAIKTVGTAGVKAVGAFVRGVQRQLGPYGWWAASIVAAAAIVAAPAAAAGLGLVSGWAALAASPVAAGAAIGMRRVGAKMATKSAVKNWGYGRQFGEFGERITADEVAHALVTRFGVAGFAESDSGPPGPPPRPGLKWKEETQRWVKSDSDNADAVRRSPEAVAADYRAAGDVSVPNSRINAAMQEIANMSRSEGAAVLKTMGFSPVPGEDPRRTALEIIEARRGGNVRHRLSDRGEIGKREQETLDRMTDEQLLTADELIPKRVAKAANQKSTPTITPKPAAPMPAAPKPTATSDKAKSVAALYENAGRIGQAELDAGLAGIDTLSGDDLDAAREAVGLVVGKGASAKSIRNGIRERILARRGATQRNQTLDRSQRQ